MRNLPNLPGVIVRWSPVLLLTMAACSTDSPTSPQAPVAPVTAYAPGGNGTTNGNGSGGRWSNGNANLGEFSVIDGEQALKQERFYPDPNPADGGTYAICSENPLEDEDGSDWLNGLDQTGHFHATEANGFVIVAFLKVGPEYVHDDGNGHYLPRPLDGQFPSGPWQVYIGRARLRAEAWLQGGSALSKRFWAKGVVAPLPAQYQDGYVGPNGDPALWTGPGKGYDLSSVALTPGAVWSERIDEIVGAAYVNDPQNLRFASCEVHQTVSGILTLNDITLDDKIPGGYNYLIPGAK